DERFLYFVFVAFDSERSKLRARMVSRENFVSERGDGIDDMVSVSLDTFNDKRRMYVFQVNPYGIQWDGMYDEAGRFDKSWDAVWHTQGKVTDQGFIVWIAIPFKSLRFTSEAKQAWGVILNRDIPRNNEASFWPAYSTRISGYANQAAPMNGLQNISPGRNFQFIPYGAFRAFRALDSSSPSGPVFAGRRAEFDGGMDAKFILKDSLVLDVTLNPDFSQVESDNPQVTVSERFEVFFPEKRPFFLENASYFATLNNVVFTRRIADPQFGARLTGKLGKYSIGALIVDDQAPGKKTSAASAMGKRAFAGIARVSRDIFKQSNIGVIFTTREFAGSYNRLGGADARFRMGKTWSMMLQAVTSSTKFLDGTTEAGPAYDFRLQREGRQFRYNINFFDRSPGFRADLGFQPRRNIRTLGQTTGYRWRPEGKQLISWGPQLFSTAIYDHSGKLLGWEQVLSLQAELAGQTNISFLIDPQYELFGPVDIPWLARDFGFHRYNSGVMFSSQIFRQVMFQGEYIRGERVNQNPVVGQDPYLVNRDSGNLNMTINPSKRLQIDNSYLFFRLTHKTNGTSIYNNHIMRSKWNLQLTRELSVRVILQYDAVLANQTNTSLETRKNFNADFLLTYLVHPGTALYLGYNSNLQNLDLIPCGIPATCSTQVVRTNRFINDARGFFAKFSYLIRF
ncbi:MAG: carbohydrate binding family 9 domain-containing protein, partial [Acidobacteria bacterium]|nr:carbohydrate binding family 9 domain-containing protein [Acidobacteriota bacterium]